MESAQDLFQTLLHARRLKYTPERRVVLDIVQQFRRPFEAEELLLQLRQSDNRASKATVYRTLKHLVEAGLLNQVFFGAGKQSYYDFAGSSRGHDHLVDIETGLIVPFESPEVLALCGKLAEKLGYSTVSHRFVIIGRRKPQ